jgi:signal transduction histidine kinase
MKPDGGGRLLLPPLFAALDAAVRQIHGELDIGRVLQSIVNAVCELADAQYAALGIVDDEGRIEQFVTAGIDDETRLRIGALPHGKGLLGLIIRENRPYRIRDIGSHPDSYGFPPNHPPMSSFLGVPITVGPTTVGRLYLTNKRDAEEFSAEDQALVEMFALHAGIAMESARLHDEVRRLTVVDERERISRELHDSVIQSIYAVTLSLDDLPQTLRDDPDDASNRIDESIDALHDVIRDIRNFIFGLRPVLLDTGGLSEGLAHLAADLRRNTGIDVRLDAVDAPDLPMSTVAELLAIVREALSNVSRHAAATRADVEVGRDEAEGWSLVIADDGRGFDPAAVGPGTHHGLANMRTRAEALGASFTLTSHPDGGTRIIVSLPNGVDGGPPS